MTISGTTASGNRLVTFHGAKDMRVDTYKFPELTMPNGKKAPSCRYRQNRYDQYMRQRPAYLSRFVRRTARHDDGS